MQKDNNEIGPIGNGYVRINSVAAYIETNPCTGCVDITKVLKKVQFEDDRYKDFYVGKDIVFKASALISVREAVHPALQALEGSEYVACIFQLSTGLSFLVFCHGFPRLDKMEKTGYCEETFFEIPKALGLILDQIAL